ncbi:MAG: ligand-binding sensor domain-containing protein, partial [Owenweeksia sp.]
MKIHFFRIVLCCMLSCLMRAQQPAFSHYTIEDGLPSNEVYETVQDDQGYLWLATDAGVSRFDGYTFTNYTTEDGLPENVVLDLYKDARGRVWFMTLGKGLAYCENNRVYPYAYNDTLSKYLDPIDVAFSFYVSPAGDVYLSNGMKGTLKVDALGQANLNPFNEHHNDSTRLYLHCMDDHLLYEFSYPPEVLYAEQSKNQANKLKARLHLNTGSEKGVNLYLDASKKISLHYLRSFYGFSRRDNKYVVNLGQIMLEIPDIVMTSENISIKSWDKRILSVFKTHRYFMIAEELGGIKIYRSLADAGLTPREHWLKGESVAHIYEDREGGLWFSSLLHGLYYLPADFIRNYTPADLSGASVLDIEVLESGKVFVVYKDIKALDILQPEGSVSRLKIPMIFNEGIMGLGRKGDTILLQKSSFRDLGLDDTEKLLAPTGELSGSYTLRTARHTHRLLRKNRKGYFLIPKYPGEILLFNDPGKKSFPVRGGPLRVNGACIDKNDRV